MKILSVSLKSSERYPGDANSLSMKTFRTGDKDQVHLVERLGLIVVLRNGAQRALSFHVSQTEHIELDAEQALSLITEPKAK